MLRIIEEGILDRSAERGAFMPWITPLHDGSFIASQHVGTSLGANDCRIEILRSSDGRAWHNEGPIHATDPNFSYRAPQINALPDGRLLMTATRFECSTAPLFDPDSEALQRPEMLLYWSSDLGLTWSEPQVVPVDLPAHKYTANGAGRLLQLTPTRWMYPLETWKPAHYQGPPDQKAAALFSADQGRTWGEWTLVADDLSGRLCYWDQMCTQLDAERIYTLLWTHSYGTSSDQNNTTCSPKTRAALGRRHSRPTCADRYALLLPYETVASRLSTTIAATRKACASPSAKTSKTTAAQQRSLTPAPKPHSVHQRATTSSPSTCSSPLANPAVYS